MTTTSPGVRNFTRAQLLRVAKLFAGDSGAASAVDRSGDERTRHPLAQTPHLEVWVMTWPPGSTTGWHDHGDASGAMVVVEGDLGDELWKGGSVQVRDLAPGDEHVIAAGQLHNVTNLGDDYAVTIHAYSPGLTEMTPYEWVDGKPVAVKPA
ncbi:cysteine dioxygenase family protein [Flexivirga sp. ID2601S]|uniref:Cysteine dioxygenase family protein n=1 Tax=Flexivirga aerilata TaxID=1656889 RepID=A0A849AF37_9MICO|nr:cysteine dioxygenase family protein [Flexivirga aerilata]NNG38186.1 cysteine dioxygenase family protein [Flexivirga aerilata]